MNGRYTKGPWRWTRVDYGEDWGSSYKEVESGPFEALWSDAEGRAVFAAQDASSYVANCDFKRTEDAPLIAAAPCLLEALKKAYLGLLRLPFGRERADLQGEMAAVRDAIAKAIGADPERVQNEYEAKAKGE